MAKITKNTSNGSHSYRVTLPQREAEAYIKKYGNEVFIKVWGNGWKLSEKKEV